VEVAINGVDFVSNDDAVFTFVGPNAGKMLWVYILITIFTALLIIVVASLISSYWNRIVMQLQESRNVYSGDMSHVVNKRPRYLLPELRPDLNSDLLPPNRGGERDVRVDDPSRRNLGGSIV
jgi:hypothetical protein